MVEHYLIKCSFLPLKHPYLFSPLFIDGVLYSLVTPKEQVGRLGLILSSPPARRVLDFPSP